VEVEWRAENKRWLPERSCLRRTKPLTQPVKQALWPRLSMLACMTSQPSGYVVYGGLILHNPEYKTYGLIMRTLQLITVHVQEDDAG